MIGGDATNGLDVDVTRLPSLPSGTNNIGDVDVLTVPADPFGANADAAATAGSTGSIQAKLRLITSQLESIKTAVETLDNAISGSEIQADVLTLPALPAGTNNIGDVDIASIAAGDNNIGNVDVVTLPALPAGTNNIGDVDVLSVPAPLSTTGGGTEATALRVTVANDSTGVLSVDDNGGSLSIDDGGGTISVDGTVTANAGTGTRDVGGNVAHDAADSGNPVKVGQKAVAHGANPTAVAAGDRSDWYANRHGIPFVLGGHPNAITLEAASTAAQTDTAIITVGAGNKIVVTQIAVVADNANTVDVGFRVGFGAANTPTTTGVVLTHPGLAAGSGFSRGDGSGLLGIGADGEDLRITSEVPTTGSIRVLVTYFTIES
jgi:hypothetical protein